VVAFAVLLPVDLHLPELTDSKALSQAQRRRLDAALRSSDGVCFGLGMRTAEQVDRLNILCATHAAMHDAVLAMPEPPDFLLVDGRPVPGLPCPSKSLVRGDSRSLSIAAASVLAKVYRDALMVEYDALYPGYGFARHKGYGTAEHLESLRRLGPCPIHRRSFAPVRLACGDEPVQLELGL
jgi:ribonuclease HII